ncbi:hypothetical protein [Neorhizobium sp. DT-125]|uniref:hypothetical protein n=1 Tax=Neorhizobium sp. DT-125 TaxID=3396163 RepID=UPI003F1A2356
MLKRVETKLKIDEAWPWTLLDKKGQQFRAGFAIVVPNGAGGWKVWGDSLYPTMESANETAARCITGVCDIVAAREVVYQRKASWYARFDRQILLDEGGKR